MKKIWIIICVLSLSFFNGSSSNGKNVEKKTEEKEIPAKKIQLSDQSGDKIPILAWGGINCSGTVDMYKDMADAGFTINYADDLSTKPAADNIPHVHSARQGR